jgi:hypothetical protein
MNKYDALGYALIFAAIFAVAHLGWSVWHWIQSWI